MAGIADLNTLCCVIIEDIYGAFLAHIFREIATHGRLLIGQVAQRCRLLLRQAKAGVSTLVQLHLLQHHTSVDGLSTYQANLTNAYNILRTSTLSELAKRKYGSTAGIIIDVLAAKGHASVRDLEAAITQSTPQTNGNHNGQNGDSGLAKLQSALRNLVRNGLVGQVRPAHLQIPHDVNHAAETSHEQVKAGGKKGEAERAQRAGRVAADIERRLDDFVSEEVLDRAFDALDDDQKEPAEEDLYLCPKYSCVITAARNAAIQQDVTKTLGKTSTKLIEGILMQTPLQVAPYEPDPNPRQELHALAMTQLHDNLQMLSHSSNGAHINGHHDSVMTNGVDENEFSDNEDIEDGLHTLRDGPYSFLHWNEDTRQWFVDRYGLATWVRDREILRLMRSRVDSFGMRLVRMMIDKGKLDEKVLQELGLLPAKEMRQSLANLKSLGFVELQEVPREPHRQPSRTMYLWFFNPVRARDVLLGELYKTMARLWERLLIVERERLKATLEKIERDDVRGRVDEVVVGKEMVELQQFQAKEKWLLAEIARLDESVALLRDV